MLKCRLFQEAILGSGMKCPIVAQHILYSAFWLPLLSLPGSTLFYGRTRVSFSGVPKTAQGQAGIRERHGNGHTCSAGVSTYSSGGSYSILGTPKTLISCSIEVAVALFFFFLT